MTSCVSRRWATHSEYIDLLNFIIERTKNVESPMNIMSLAREFKGKSGATQSVGSLKNRIETLRTRIQSYEHIDTDTKVKVLFALSSSVYVYFLGELRKDAVVEVDDLNRITKYEANDRRLTLYGDHSRSAKRKSDWIERKKKQNAAKKYYNFGDDNDDDKSDEEIDHSEEESDEYSSEEFDSDDHKNHMDEFCETKRNGGGNRKNNKNPKRKNMCSSASASEKKRKKGTTGSSALNWTGESSNNSMRSYELDDYDTNYSIDDEVKLEPFRGPIQEDFKEFNGEEDIQQIPKPTTIMETPVKIEVEEPVEVKPETSHSFIIKFFEAMQSLIVCLDTPSLSWIQSEINQKSQKLGRSDEMILNDEIVLVIELLIARIVDNSVLNLSKNAEFVNLSNFLCYLKASILNSKMSGMDDLVKNISELIEESQNKRIPMENVANALYATLDINGS
ncbi:unnamed protein product [Caenorhabditis brenneri]